MKVMRPKNNDCSIDVWVGFTEDEVKKMERGFFSQMLERIREVVNL